MHEKSALHDAVLYSENVEVIQELANATAVNLQDSDGNSPLHLAVQYNKKSFVEVLIQCGATVDLRNLKKDTPLIIAVWNGNLEIVKLLLSARAELTLVDYDMRSPLHVALICPVPNQGILIELMKYGANIFFLRVVLLPTPFDYSMRKYPTEDPLSARTLLKYTVLLQSNPYKRTWFQLEDYKKYLVYPELKSFIEECNQQMKRMLSEFIHPNFCFLDFVRKGFECCPMFQKKTAYKDLIINRILNISRNYPAYTDVIAYHLGKSDLCLKSMELCVYTVKKHPEGNQRIFLTPDTIFLIAGLLPCEDILNLTIAFSDSQHFATHDFGFQNLSLGKSTKRKLH